MTAQLASYISQNRQQLSRICVQAQSRLVLDRVEGLGRGTGEAARRRGHTSWLERKWEKERQAQLIATSKAGGSEELETSDFEIY